MAKVTFDEDDATISTDNSVAVPIENVYDADPDSVLLGGEAVPVAEIHTAVNAVLEELGLID